MEAVEARAFVGLQFEQLDDAHGLVGRRDRLQLAGGGGEHDAGGGDVEDLDAAVRQRGEQLDDVEVVDEVVGQLHHGAGENGFASHERPPGERRPTRRCRDPIVDGAQRHPIVAGAELTGRRAIVEAEPARRRRRRRRRRRCRPLLKAWARSRSRASSTGTPSCTETMPAAWWTTKRKLPPDSSSGPSAPGAAAACMVDDRPRRDVGDDQGVGVLIVGERAGTVAVQVERTEVDVADRHREPEHRPGAGVDGGHGELRPPDRRRVRQIGFDDRGVLAVGVDARTFAQRVLQLLDQRADGVGRAHRPLRLVAGQQHDPGARHHRDLGAHRTQPRGFTGAVIGGESRQDPDQHDRQASSTAGISERGEPLRGDPSRDLIPTREALSEDQIDACPGREASCLHPQRDPPTRTAIDGSILPLRSTDRGTRPDRPGGMLHNGTRSGPRRIGFERGFSWTSSPLTTTTGWSRRRGEALCRQIQRSGLLVGASIGRP